MARQARNSDRRLTRDERQRVEQLHAQIEQEKPEILSRAKRMKAEIDARTTGAATSDLASEALNEAQQAIRHERRTQGYSLAEMERRTGISKPFLSRLERDSEANPTLETLSRIAAALGKRIHISLVDAKLPER